MARYLKCRYCDEMIPYSEKDNLEIEVYFTKKGRSQKKYYHKECYPKHLENQEFIKKEVEERDDLDRVIKKIYNVNFPLPHTFWALVNDLRNGTNRFSKFWRKKYKQGVPYHVIKEAYFMSKDDIEWARLNKKFKTFKDELTYGLIIVQSKVNDAYKKLKAREQQQKINSANEENQINMMIEDREVEYKKKENEDDLSFLLGDD